MAYSSCEKFSSADNEPKPFPLSPLKCCHLSFEGKAAQTVLSAATLCNFSDFPNKKKKSFSSFYWSRKTVSTYIVKVTALKVSRFKD